MILEIFSDLNDSMINAIYTVMLITDYEGRFSVSCATICQQYLDNELLLEGKHKAECNDLTTQLD